MDHASRLACGVTMCGSCSFAHLSDKEMIHNSFGMSCPHIRALSQATILYLDLALLCMCYGGGVETDWCVKLQRTLEIFCYGAES